MKRIRFAGTIHLALIFVWVLSALPAAANPQPVVIGLDADMSSSAAQAGRAIRRGIELAIDEINAAGGVLGRQLKLTVRDHRGNPARGRDNIEELARLENIVAVVGGLHTPVALYELEAVHRNKILYLVPWAAGTPVVDNDYKPSYVFRVSIRDAFAGGFLIERAIAAGYRKPGFLLERTGWGRSNEAALLTALTDRDLPRTATRWFNWGVPASDIEDALRSLSAADVDVIILVANPREGALVVKALASLPRENRIPVISHWGITGADFARLAGNALKEIDLTFLQTYSFIDPPFPDRADRVVKAYCTKYGDCSGPRDIFSPAGTAHAYDLVHLLAKAIELAGTTNMAEVREALEALKRHEGLVRNYDPPFTASRHDALDSSDFHLARFDKNGVIVPIGGR